MEGEHPGRQPGSPWQQVLGDDMARLHPRLHAYFSAIPPGRVGRGRGVFTRVGTPRRWVRPVLALLAHDGVVFPVWEHDVAFAIENRFVDGVLHARRTFGLSAGERVMTDALTARDGVIVDALGRHGRLRAELSARVVDGALQLRSTRTRWRGIPIPLAPRVALVERFDDAVARQHVSLTLTAPVVGVVYEYHGHFDYRIEDA